jgi:TorA maturation chaperone TorD
MNKSAQSELEVAVRHLTWAGESLQRVGQAVQGATYRGALAIALGDIAHLQRQVQQILLTINAGRGGGQ